MEVFLERNCNRVSHRPLHDMTSLMLVAANLANTKRCRKHEND